MKVNVTVAAVHDAKEFKDTIEEIQKAIKECSQVTDCTVEIKYEPYVAKAVN